MLVCKVSWRWIEPLPSYCEVESVVRMRPGRILFACEIVCEPMKSVMPESSLLVRSRWVSLAKFAESVMFTVTVSRSPIWCARWSLKKEREPLRHSEFGLYDTVSGLGIGIDTGL